MIAFPTPFFGRGVFRGKPRDIALAPDIKTVGGVYVADLAFRVSLNGRKWYRGALSGDLKNALRSDGPYGAAFRVSKIVPFKGKLIIAGGLISSSPYRSRAAIFVYDGERFLRQTLANDNLNISGSEIVDVAANADYVVAIGRNGVLFYWSGTGGWLSRTDLPVGASPATNRHMNAVAAASGGIVCVGSYSNADGTPGAPILVSAATPAAVFASRSLPTMDYLNVASAGNVVAVASATSPAGNTRIITAPLSNLTTWASAGLGGYTQQINCLLYDGARWVGGSGYNKAWIKSTTGTSGWAAVVDADKQPWGETAVEHPFVNSGIVVNGEFIVHYGFYGGGSVGGISISDNGDDWVRPANTGLAPKPYVLGSFAA